MLACRFDWAAMAYFAAATLAAYGQSVTVRTQNSVAALEAPAVMLREIDDPHSERAGFCCRTPTIPADRAAWCWLPVETERVLPPWPLQFRRAR